MKKEFYIKKLTELRDLVEMTEVMIEKGNDDLLNVLTFRTRLKGLVEDCNKEIERRLEE